MEKDILIIGGGPAGLSTALHLQQTSPELIPRTLVLEKAHYPRPKLCAGGLVTDAEVLLQKLGLDVREIPHVDNQSAHFNFAGKGLTIPSKNWDYSIRLPGSYSLRIIRRDEFDAWLAGKARERGIEIREGVTVKAIRREGEWMVVETDAGIFHAKMVVGADGSNGIVRRCSLPSQAGTGIIPHEPIFTARVLELLAPPIPNPRHAPLETYFDFFPVPEGIAGYTWDFPTQVNGQPMRCWGIYDANMLPGDQKAALKPTLGIEMARCGYDLAEYEIKSHPIHWFDPFISVCVPQIMLVGDAAGADPIFGEGISMALGYGRLAARELASAFKQDDFSLKHYRRRLLCSPLGQTLLARWFIAHLVYFLKWKWFQFLLWRVLKPLVIVIAWIFVLNWARRMR